MAFQKMDRPLRGDLLRVFRKQGYYHFGIAVNETEVIHFSAPDGDMSENKRQLKIIKTSLERFLRGDQLEVEVPYTAKYSRDEVVERAEKYLDTKFRDRNYNLVTNNCEHFARYCYDGKAESKQVIQGALLTAATGSVLVGVTIGAVARKVKKKITKK